MGGGLLVVETRLLLTERGSAHCSQCKSAADVMNMEIQGEEAQVACSPGAVSDRAA